MASAFSLHDLGWDDSRDDEFPAGLPAGPLADLQPGRVARVDRTLCTVLAPSGELRVEYGAEIPCVGDWVRVRTLPDERLELAGILPRRTTIVRGNVGRESRGGLSGDSTGHFLAANVDIVYIAEPAATDRGPAGTPASGSSGPDFSFARVERLLALAWQSGAQPVVLITKADLAADLPALVSAVAESAPGAEVHAVSALHEHGLEAVRLRPGQTAVLLGPSGAGKSTLVNALAGAELMVTQQVRASDGRGRHTTTYRELLVLPGGGLVIDTPGLRRIGLYDIDDGLDQAFADIGELAAGCRFADCAHDAEPDCAVLAAVASGELPERRLASWRKLRREAAWMAGRTDARLRAEQARKWKVITKEMRRANRHRP